MAAPRQISDAGLGANQLPQISHYTSSDVNEKHIATAHIPVFPDPHPATPLTNASHQTTFVHRREQPASPNINTTVASQGIGKISYQPFFAEEPAEAVGMAGKEGVETVSGTVHRRGVEEAVEVFRNEEDIVEAVEYSVKTRQQREQQQQEQSEGVFGDEYDVFGRAVERTQEGQFVRGVLNGSSSGGFPHQENEQLTTEASPHTAIG
ncbi:hypothetical protein HDV00_007330 [Rhizophlyctis rosea]|nr:hypothetical protein HDV00_007330 [Rhizophlyctis rosea]